MKKLSGDTIGGIIFILFLLGVMFVFLRYPVEQYIFEKNLKVGTCYVDTESDPFEPVIYECITDIKGPWVRITKYEERVWRDIKYMKAIYARSSNTDNWFTLRSSEVVVAGNINNLVWDPRPDIVSGKWYSDGKYDRFITEYAPNDISEVMVKTLAGKKWGKSIDKRCEIHGLDDSTIDVDDLKDTYTEITDKTELEALNKCLNGGS